VVRACRQPRNLLRCTIGHRQRWLARSCLRRSILSLTGRSARLLRVIAGRNPRLKSVSRLRALRASLPCSRVMQLLWRCWIKLASNPRQLQEECILGLKRAGGTDCPPTHAGREAARLRQGTQTTDGLGMPTPGCRSHANPCISTREHAVAKVHKVTTRVAAQRNERQHLRSCLSRTRATL
jgi:hypothetical protein